jgi:hypothetical protein
MSYHSAVQENIEYASSSSSWEQAGAQAGAQAEDSTGKYKSTVTNIMTKHCAEIRSQCDEVISPLVTFSKKKLKDLIHKHSTEIFSFLAHPDKIPNLLFSAENVFRKYGQEVPTIKGVPTNQILRELNVNASLDTVVQTIETQLAAQQCSGTLATLLKQLRWLFHEYKNTGEEVLRLETTLFQKMEMLDKIHQRLPSIMNLTETASLPSLIDAFSVYAKEAFQGAHFEENYTQLVEEYKKWNVCRQIISAQHVMRDTPDPPCAICLLDTVSYAIVPCGHTFCSSCSKKQNTTCYICRGIIRERLKLFFM